MKSVKNVRDLGGAYSGGLIVKSGLLLRGARLGSMTKRDENYLIATFGDLVVVDLRSETEKTEKPDKCPRLEYRFMPIFHLDQPGLTHGKNDVTAILAALPTMDQLYSMMLHDEYLENLREVVRFIMTSEKPVYFHCTEGKDRTGVVGAILLMSLGVSREDVIKDYLMTNETNEKRARNIARLIYLYKRDKVIAKKIHDLFIAKLEYLQVLFDVIDNEYGSLERFLSEGLKINDVLPSFRAKMLVQ